MAKHHPHTQSGCWQILATITFPLLWPSWGNYASLCGGQVCRNVGSDQHSETILVVQLNLKVWKAFGKTVFFQRPRLENAVLVAKVEEIWMRSRRNFSSFTVYIWTRWRVSFGMTMIVKPVAKKKKLWWLRLESVFVVSCC